MTGTLITFEGIDGSGKSTQRRLLTERLQQAGHHVEQMRDPGGTPLAERVRALVLDAEHDDDVAPMAELLLFSAARAQLCAERIRPALEAGAVVISDRFYDSTLAYQNAGRQIDDPEWVRALQQRATGGLTPDRTYLVETPLRVALRRRGEALSDRMEKADGAFYERVGAAYAQLAEREPERFRRLDGTEPVEAIRERIWRDARSLF
jgi:dTMP kinase